MDAIERIKTTAGYSVSDDDIFRWGVGLDNGQRHLPGCWQQVTDGPSLIALAVSLGLPAIDWEQATESEQTEALGSGGTVTTYSATGPTVGLTHATGPEVAALRQLVGLTIDELADELGVNPRTVRSWEQGRDRMGAGVRVDLARLVRRHDDQVSRCIASGKPIKIAREKGAASMPRGWYVAALARAMAQSPAVRAEWV